jgi:hypothetical protein
MLNVVLGSMCNLFSMYANCTVAMNTSNVTWRCSYSLEHWNFLPAPFTLAIDDVLTTRFASRHKVMRHFQSPQKSAFVILNRLNPPTPQDFERSERSYALGEPKHSDNLELEVARSVAPKHMTYDGEATTVCEVGVVSFAVEEVYFVTT